MISIQFLTRQGTAIIADDFVERVEVIGDCVGFFWDETTDFVADAWNSVVGWVV